MKQHPKVAGHGENLPVEILRCLSEWFSVLEDRNAVPGSFLLYWCLKLEIIRQWMGIEIAFTYLLCVILISSMFWNSS